MNIEKLKPSDLRIRNFVFSRETQGFQRIVGIAEENPFIDAITFDYVQYEDIEPIPLTEEWLLKFRFSQSFTTDPQEPDATSKYWIGNFVLFFDPNIGVSFWHNDECIIIKYVNQLQNLFHALTGEELDIKI